MEHSSKLIEILLVEDSPTDALMAREALEQNRLINRIHHVEDGVEALMFLRQEGKYKVVRRPDLIILDLNLPKKSGREVLTEIKEDVDLRLIPVVVLTTSSAQEDIRASYGSHANCHITKPVEFAKLVKVIREINGFWFGIVTLPGEVTNVD